LWLHSLKVAQLLRSAACLHTNQSRSYLNHLVIFISQDPFVKVRNILLALKIWNKTSVLILLPTYDEIVLNFDKC